MTAYLINIGLLTVEAYIFLYIRPSARKKRIFCVLAVLQWIILSGLRNIEIGDDTIVYKAMFDDVKQMSWGEIYKQFTNNLLFNGSVKDPGYYIFEKAFQIFSADYQAYLVFIAVLFHAAMGIWIYKLSKDPYISFLLYSTLFYEFFAVTGQRQTIATALVIFIGFFLIRNNNRIEQKKRKKRKKLVTFLMVLLCAATIHRTSLVSAAMCFLAYKKPTRKYIAAVLCAVPIVFVFRNRIMSVLAENTGYTQYSRQYLNAGTYIFTFFLILVLLAALWRMKPVLTANPDAIPYYNALFAAVIFLPLTYVDPNAMRIVQYFSVFLMLLIPEIVSSFRRKEQSILYFLIFIILVLRLIRSVPVYKFFWQ